MKINNKVLSVPPYVSTPWKNINCLYVNDKEVLVIILKDKTTIEIPNLPKEVREKIFEAHCKYLEDDKEELTTFKDDNKSKSFSFGVPFQLGSGELENLSGIMQHNPDQSNALDMPKEILDKIVSISKLLGLNNNSMNVPPAEPHCNCVYCQIARKLNEDNKTIAKDSKEGEKKEEQLVSDEELKFKEWDISQIDDKLYLVSNPLNKEEQYRVFLGKPVGCTCGKKNCIHIEAVLNS